LFSENGGFGVFWGGGGGEEREKKGIFPTIRKEKAAVLRSKREEERGLSISARPIGKKKRRERKVGRHHYDEESGKVTYTKRKGKSIQIRRRGTKKKGVQSFLVAEEPIKNSQKARQRGKRREEWRSCLC